MTNLDISPESLTSEPYSTLYEAAVNSANQIVDNYRRALEEANGAGFSAYWVIDNDLHKIQRERFDAAVGVRPFGRAHFVTADGIFLSLTEQRYDDGTPYAIQYDSVGRQLPGSIGDLYV